MLSFKLLVALSLLGLTAAMATYSSSGYGRSRQGYGPPSYNPPTYGQSYYDGPSYSNSHNNGYGGGYGGHPGNDAAALERILDRLANSGHTEQGRQNKMKRLTDSVNFNLDIANTIRAQQTLEEENDQQDKRLAGIAAKVQIIKDIKATIDQLTSEAADRTAEIEAIQDTRRQIQDEINELNDIDDGINDRLASLLASAIETTQRVNRLNIEIADNKRGVFELSLLVNRLTRSSNLAGSAVTFVNLDTANPTAGAVYDPPFPGVPASVHGVTTFHFNFNPPSGYASHADDFEAQYGGSKQAEWNDRIDYALQNMGSGGWDFTKADVNSLGLYFYKLQLPCADH